MTVEEVRGVNNSIGRFPIGMRVLAIDDNPTCLELLDGLLRKCQFHVTSTTQAIRALQMLRENRNLFDLVISDVHMPDMDGFKLLELIGLEMHLPVIMLSANSDPKLVMKGITHGACDYLVKLVRLEELRNVWQHVIRNYAMYDQDKSNHGGEGEQEAGSGDPNGKLNRKRKMMKILKIMGMKMMSPQHRRNRELFGPLIFIENLLLLLINLGLIKPFLKGFSI